MALRIVLIAAPFCILAVLAVIDYFLRRGAGRVWNLAPNSSIGASIRVVQGISSSPPDQSRDTWAVSLTESDPCHGNGGWPRLTDQ